MSRVVLFEMSSQDPDRAAQFYEAVLGWKASPPQWGYRAVTTGSNESQGAHI